MHRAQGATYERAHILAAGGGRELAYVAMSRARQQTTIHLTADNLDQGVDDLQRDWGVPRHQRWITHTPTIEIGVDQPVQDDVARTAVGKAVRFETADNEPLGEWLDEHVVAVGPGGFGRRRLVADLVGVDGEAGGALGPAADEVLDLVVVVPAQPELDAHWALAILVYCSSLAIVYAIALDRKVTPMTTRTTGALARKVAELTASAALSYEDIGRIVDASARSVGRWQSGDVVPQRLNKQRLIELAYVAQALQEVLEAQDANLWMFSPNRALQHDTPADRIRAGDYKVVLDLIEAIADGVVT